MWKEEFHKRNHALRLILWLSSLAFVSTGFLRVGLHPDYVDPLWLRLALGGLMALLALTSHRIQAVMRQLEFITYLCYALMLGWVLCCLYWNALHPSYVLVALAMLLLLALGIEQKRTMWAFVATFSGCLLGLALVVEHPKVATDIFVILVIILALMGGGIQTRQITIKQQLAERMQTSMMMARELAHSEARLEAMFENPLYVQIFLSPDGRVVTFNRAAHAWAQNLGKGLKQGDPFSQYATSPEHLDAIRRDFQKAMAGESIVSERKLHFQGRELFYQIQYTPALSQDQQLLGVVFTCLDITRYRHTEQQLMQREANVRALFEAIPDMIFRLDAQGNCLDFKPATHDRHHQDPKRIVGMNIRDTPMAHSLQQQLLSTIEQAVNTQTLQVWEYSQQHRDRTLHYEARVSSGKHQEVLCVVRDVTEQKEFLHQLAAEKERAEKASRAKAEFLSVMSHEIRTPMNAVIGSTDLLLEEHPREDQQENLQTLKFSAENLLVIINDILDYNKIEAGKIEFESRPINLILLGGQLVNTVRPRAAANQLKVHLDVDQRLPETVLGDQTRLSQILLNLLNNAIKFTPKGRITLVMQLERLDEQVAHIAFSVIDTGIGIEHGKQAHIFEQFTQASSDTTRKFGGTGLGLAICKNLTELQGGTVRVQSEPGEGSTFTVCLPMKVAPEAGARMSQMDYQQTPKDLQGARVLIVEDNQVNQKIARKFLEKWGAKVTLADDGRAALEKIEQEAFEIVLMDLQMPVMDGFEATQHIRAMAAPKSSIPIIALTASALVEAADEVRATGMDDFATKPFKPHELFQKIAHWVAHRRAQRPGQGIPRGSA